MQLTRRRLFAGTTALVAVALVGACAQEAANNVQDGITEAGNVIGALRTAYSDLQIDAPTLVPKGSATDLQVMAAFTAADATLANMNATQPALAVGTSLRAIESDFNTVANLTNVAIAGVGAAVPSAQPFVMAFQAGTLIIETVVEPLIAKLIPGTASAVRIPQRYQPPSGLTVAGAKMILAPLASRAHAVRH